MERPGNEGRAVKRTRQGGKPDTPLRLIAYCGLYCGDCPRYRGKASRLALDLRQELERSGLTRFARRKSVRRGPFRKFDAFWNLLGIIAGFECPGCRKAGCSVTCQIRPCCVRRGLNGCWECIKLAACRESQGLRVVHGKGLVYNLRALKRKGPKGFLRGQRYWLGRPRAGSSSS